MASLFLFFLHTLLSRSKSLANWTGHSATPGRSQALFYSPRLQCPSKVIAFKGMTSTFFHSGSPCSIHGLYCQKFPALLSPGILLTTHTPMQEVSCKKVLIGVFFFFQRENRSLFLPTRSRGSARRIGLRILTPDSKKIFRDKN